MSWGNVMELIQNWDNQNQQAKSFQMKYNLKNQNQQTLTNMQLRPFNMFLHPLMAI